MPINNVPEYNETLYESILKDIVATLQDAGYKVEFPVYHVGEVAEPFVEVKWNGSRRSEAYRRTDIDNYSIQIFVPRTQYSKLEPMMRDIKRIMYEKMYPMLIDDGYSQPSFYDDTNQSHYVELTYTNYKFNKFD